MEYTARMNAFRTLYGETAASPYHYGRVPEVTVNIDGSSTVQKWYTLGRLSREKVQFLVIHAPQFKVMMVLTSA